MRLGRAARVSSLSDRSQTILCNCTNEQSTLRGFYTSDLYNNNNNNKKRGHQRGGSDERRILRGVMSRVMNSAKTLYIFISHSISLYGLIIL